MAKVREVTLKMEGDVLVLRMPCGKAEIEAATDSKSGKTRLISSSRGVMKPDGIDADVRLSFNLMVKD